MRVGRRGSGDKQAAVVRLPGFDAFRLVNVCRRRAAGGSCRRRYSSLQSRQRVGRLRIGRRGNLFRQASNVRLPSLATCRLVGVVRRGADRSDRRTSGAIERTLVLVRFSVRFHPPYESAFFSPSAVHLVAGSTTSPVFLQIAGSGLARPLVNASVERFSRSNHVFTGILLHPSILHRLFLCIRSVSGSASYGVQGHSVNARMQTYACAQQARASAPVLSTRCFCDFCTLH